MFILDSINSLGSSFYSPISPTTSLTPLSSKSRFANVLNTKTRVPDHLQDVYKQVFQATQQPSTNTTAASVFEDEDRLIQALFPQNQSGCQAVIDFVALIKKNALAGFNSIRPYTSEEMISIRAKVNSSISKLDQEMQTAIANIEVSEIPGILTMYKQKFSDQVDSFAKEFEAQQLDRIMTGPVDPNAINDAKEQIAKIIFLADKNPSAAASLLNKKNIQGSLRHIENAFNQQFQAIVDDLKDLRKKHTEFKLQDPDAFSATQTPLAIAKAIITSQGLLNLGLTDLVKKYFYGNKELLQHEKDLLQTLQDFKKHPELANTIANITKPADSSFVSNNIIRITLKLPYDYQPTDNQARIVALAAILSDMRQGSVGSCFATSISIMMLGALKGKVLNDFLEILTTGKLTRPSTTEQTDFVPVLDIGDSTCQKKMAVSLDGHIETFQKYLWDSPGLLSACRQLNIQPRDVQQAVTVVLKSIFESNHISNNATVNISMEDVITALSANGNNANLSEYERQERIDLALTAFNSETNTSLLRAWETCLASMAEAGHSGFIRKKIQDCIIEALNNQWSTSVPFYYSYGSSTVSQEAANVQKVFRDVLDSRINIRYDEKENIEKDDNQQATTGDGHSESCGAFVIYELKQGDKTTAAKRVTNPEEFNNFVLNSIKVTREIMNSMASSDVERQKYQQTIDKIVTYLNGQKNSQFDFVRNCIWSYEPSSKKIANPVRDWRKIEHLPFRDATGNFNVPIFNKATGIDSGDATVVTPNNAMDLAVAFIQYGRERAKKDNFLNDDEPNQRYMVDTNTHAFSLIPENDSIVEAMKTDEDPRAWIQRNIIDPSVPVRDFKLSPNQMSTFAAIIGAILIPKELQPYYNSQAKTMNANNNTVNQVSSNLLNLVMSLSRQNDPSKREYPISVITSVLLENILQPEQKNLLGQKSARFADTNWEDNGSENIYFTFFYNPVTSSLNVGTVKEDGTGLRCPNQNDWVTGIRWEMYNVSLDNPQVTAGVA